MADLNQFGSAKPPQSADAQHCAQFEAMLTDALDGTLSTADQTAFDLHMVGCPACTAMLAEAKRGAAWLTMLKSPAPEPPATLLERILAQTSGETSAAAKPAIVLGPTDRLRQPASTTLLGQPVLTPFPANYPAAAYTAGTVKVLPFRQRVAAAFRIQNIRHTLMQPRLAMTAAMAFFSIALTLNLTGVRLSQLRASDFTPSSIKRTFFATNAKVVRYYDNLVVVYQLESRVRDLQRSTESESSTTPAPQNSPDTSRPQQQNQQPDDQNPQNPDQKKANPRPKSGTSQRENPQGGGKMHFVGSTPARGSSPAATEALAIFAPNVFKHIQEGGLV
ncbi:MAG TPA: zf-HC2 domain-containing protein [Acidobacteriaceae bacterium]